MNGSKPYGPSGHRRTPRRRLSHGAAPRFLSVHHGAIAIQLRIFSDRAEAPQGKLRKSGIFIVDDRPWQKAPAGRHVRFNVASNEPPRAV